MKLDMNGGGHGQAASPRPVAGDGPDNHLRLPGLRILMYSHDTFGLGHLRRCRTIAHALVEQFRGVEVLIISGSPIAGAFDFRARVDFIKIPSVVKLYNGEYTSMDAHVDIQSILNKGRIAQHIHRRRLARDAPGRDALEHERQR